MSGKKNEKEVEEIERMLNEEGNDDYNINNRNDNNNNNDKNNEKNDNNRFLKFERKKKCLLLVHTLFSLNIPVLRSITEVTFLSCSKTSAAYVITLNPLLNQILTLSRQYCTILLAMTEVSGSVTR